MSNKIRFKIKHSIYLFLVIIVFFATGCATETVGLKKGKKTPVLVQDLTFLMNSNGKIVKQ